MTLLTKSYEATNEWVVSVSVFQKCVNLLCFNQIDVELKDVQEDQTYLFKIGKCDLSNRLALSILFQTWLVTEKSRKSQTEEKMFWSTWLHSEVSLISFLGSLLHLLQTLHFPVRTVIMGDKRIFPFLTFLKGEMWWLLLTPGHARVVVCVKCEQADRSCVLSVWRLVLRSPFGFSSCVSLVFSRQRCCTFSKWGPIETRSQSLPCHNWAKEVDHLDKVNSSRIFGSWKVFVPDNCRMLVRTSEFISILWNNFKRHPLE